MPDRTIAGLVVDGVYRIDHLLSSSWHGVLMVVTREVAAVHVRRLEALHRAGIVDRMAEVSGASLTTWPGAAASTTRIDLVEGFVRLRSRLDGQPGGRAQPAGGLKGDAVRRCGGRLDEDGFGGYAPAPAVSPNGTAAMPSCMKSRYARPIA